MSGSSGENSNEGSTLDRVDDTFLKRQRLREWCKKKRRIRQKFKLKVKYEGVSMYQGCNEGEEEEDGR